MQNLGNLSIDLSMTDDLKAKSASYRVLRAVYIGETWRDMHTAASTKCYLQAVSAEAAIAEAQKRFAALDRQSPNKTWKRLTMISYSTHGIDGRLVADTVYDDKLRH